MGNLWEICGNPRKNNPIFLSNFQKKVLSLVLCLAMMLSVMVMGAGAAFTDQDKIVNEEAVDMCAALNIINGYEDDSYRPEGNITRAETTKLIAMMLNGGRDTSLVVPNDPSFSDVRTSPNSKWAEKYIEYCAAAGIVCGWDGIFAPDNNVTGTEAAKMLLVSLGYDAVKEGFEGAQWAVNVNVKATQVGLYDGLKTMDVNAPLTRDNAAQMIWNALNVETVRYLASGDVFYGPTLLAKAYGANVVEGILTDVSYNKDAKVYTYTIDPADAKDDVVVTSKVDYTDLFAMNVTVVKSGKEAKNIFAPKAATVVEGVWGDVSYTPGKTTMTVDGQKYGIDNVKGSADLKIVAYNDYDNANFKANNVWDQYSFRAIDTDNGGDIDTIVVYPYVVLKTDMVKTNTFRASALADKDAYLTATEANAQDATLTKELTGTVTRDEVIVNGTVAQDGYVMAVPARFTAEGMDTYTVLNAQTATITKASVGDKMLTFGDTELNGKWLAPLSAINQISVGKDYSYIEVNGYLFIVDGSGIVPAATNYVVATAKSSTPTTVNNTYETTLLFSDGTTKTVNATKEAYVGTMYTYTVNAAGNYVLTPVKDGTRDAANEADRTVFDYQQVYQDGAKLNGADGKGETGRVSEKNDSVYFANETQLTKLWAVEDDAVIFAFINRNDAGNADLRDNEYVVLTGADLKGLDTAKINWAFTAANTTSQGVPTVEMGYVMLTVDPFATTEYAYVDGSTSRDGAFSVSVPVITADGSKTLTSSKYLSQKDAALDVLFKQLTDKMVVKVTLDKDGNLVGFTPVDTTSGEVTKWNGTDLLIKGQNKFFTKTSDTVMIKTGDDEFAVGDTIQYVLNSDGVALDLIVY